MNKIIKIILWVLSVIVIIGAVLLGIGINDVNQQKKTQQTVDAINNRYIDLADVMGKNLPPVPDATVNNSTIAGIDANHNGIRDDVELAIFKEYPNNAKIRAAELQYAQALQSELIDVFNSETLTATLQKEDAASLCITTSGPDVSLQSSSTEIKDAYVISQQREGEVDSLVLNTDLRKKQESESLKFMTTYASGNGGCDIALSSLAN